MSDKKDYSVSEFKAKALGLVEEVSRSRKSLTITKRGKPIAKLVPIELVEERPPPGKLAGTLWIEGDIVSPLGPKAWDSAK